MATPIGNLKDITLRALEALKSVDLIAAEDTRRTVKLLNHYDIKCKTVSYHDHSGAPRRQMLIDELAGGRNIALVSDAGTPLISDPGFDLVLECAQNGIRVESLPGPCAAVSAVTLSGIDCSSFLFRGFLSAKSTARKKELLELKALPWPFVVYEGLSRVVKTLTDIRDVLGEDRPLAVARELTKLHEEVFRGSAKEAVQYFGSISALKGEFVITVGAAKKADASDDEIVNALKECIDAGRTKKEAVTLVTAALLCSKNRVYQLMLENF